jgi:hypothetical protein
LLANESSPELKRAWPVDEPLLDALTSVWANPIG